MPHTIRTLQYVVRTDEPCHEDFERVRNPKSRSRMLRRWGSVVRHRHVYCERRLGEIINEVDWSDGDEICAMRRYAVGCINSWNMGWRWPEPGDLISEALYRCMTGDRKFHYPSRKGLTAFLCFTMKSIARGEKEKTSRRGDRVLVEEPEFDMDGLRRERAQLPIATDDGDPITRLTAAEIYQAFLNSITRELKTYVTNRNNHPDWEAEDHAHAMGVSVQHIYNLNRRLHRLRARWIRLGGSRPPARPSRRE